MKNDAKNTDFPSKMLSHVRKNFWIAIIAAFTFTIIALSTNYHIDQQLERYKAYLTEQPQASEEIQITMAAQMFYIDERRIPVSIQQLHDHGTLKIMPEGYKAHFDYKPGDYEYPHEGLIVNVEKVSS